MKLVSNTITSKKGCRLANKEFPTYQGYKLLKSSLKISVSYKLTRGSAIL